MKPYRGMTVQEVAEALSVSQLSVHRLLRTGRLLEVGRVGRMVLIDEGSVHRVAADGIRRGRPWSPRTAWSALALIGGEDSVWVSAAEKSRLRSRLRDLGPVDIALLSRERAMVRRFRASDDVLQELRAYLTPTGASALEDERIAGEFGLAAGNSSVHRVDGYVAKGETDALVQAFGLIADPAGNVVIREPEVEAAFASGKTPLAVIAVDLMESPASRERARAGDVVERLKNENLGRSAGRRRTTA